MQECGSICRASACPSEAQDYFPGAKNRKAPGRHHDYPPSGGARIDVKAAFIPRTTPAREQGNDASASTIFGRND